MASIIRKFKEAPASISAICRQSDSSDAGLLVDLLVHHREKLRRIHPDTEQTRTLQFLVEARRKFISDKTRYSNRLTAYLKIVFPAGSGLVSEVSSPIAGDFLERWPSLQKVQEARPGLFENSSFNTTAVSPTTWIAVCRKFAGPCPRLTMWR